jgi:hypothetical protein
MPWNNRQSQWIPCADSRLLAEAVSGLLLVYWSFSYVTQHYSGLLKWSSHLLVNRCSLRQTLSRLNPRHLGIKDPRFPTTLQNVF